MSLREKRKLIFAVAFLSVLTIGITTNIVSAVSMTPATTSTLVGTSATFTASGLDDTDTFYVELDGVEVISDIEPSSAGVATFQVSSSVAGTFMVKLYNSTADLQASSILVVNDLFLTIMPYVVLLVGMTILFGVIKELKF